MKPFKMFFGIALAIFFFFFIAKFVVFALIAAAVMTVIFKVVRKVKSYLWEDEYGNLHIERYDPYVRHEENVEPLFTQGERRNYRDHHGVRIIKIN